MRIRSALVGAAAVALATVGIVGSTAASAATPHASTGPVSFEIWSTNPADNAIAVIAAHGKIHAQGADVTVSSNKSGTKGVDRFEFPKGSLTVPHATTKGTSHDTMDRTTCVGTHSERGTFAVTGGTGRYAGASGGGHYALQVLFIGCSQTKPPSVFLLHVVAVGSLRD